METIFAVPPAPERLTGQGKELNTKTEFVLYVANFYILANKQVMIQ
jgi:hypothetical protein